MLYTLLKTVTKDR